MSVTAIHVEGLGKRYEIGATRERYFSLRDRVSRAAASPFRWVAGALREQRNSEETSEIWALRDVSFDVAPGEVVGIIGPNGAGKSTLLKIISRITEPTEGSAEFRGRVGSLLEVGTGFHPELTGRENVFLNGAILGMGRAEIARKFDEIVEFSGVERFLDTPVKRYSSGMTVRLAFAVAAHLEPEILVVDEVLSVGAAAFQKKCMGKMEGITGEGRTVLFVSHNMAAIRRLCPRVLLLEQGRIALDAEPEVAISRYLDRNLGQGAVVTSDKFEGELQGVIRREDPTIRLREVGLMDGSGVARNTFNSDEAIQVFVGYDCLTAVDDLRVVVYLVDEEDQPIIVTQNVDDPSQDDFARTHPGAYVSRCTIPPNLMGGKRFYITVHLIHPKVEHLILNKVLGVEVSFQGYNGRHEGWSSAFLRPELQWATRKLSVDKKG